MFSTYIAYTFMVNSIEKVPSPSGGRIGWGLNMAISDNIKT
jgi:hypothetical protein